MNNPKTKVTLTDLLDLFVDNGLKRTNCHAVGEIVSFDSDTQLCEVQISYAKRKTVLQNNKEIEEPVNYPVLGDVPLVQVSGGDSGIVFPVQAGDSCLIFFNDRDIDNWYGGKKEGLPKTKRYHSLSDAFAIVGPKNKDEKLSVYEDDKAVFFYEQTKILIGEKIKLENQVTDLKTVLDALIDATKGIVTSNGGTVNGASQAALDTVKQQIGSLLE